MRKSSVIYSAGLACVFLLAAPNFAFGGAPDQAPTITVVGTGEISASPDTAEIYIGVVTRADSASKAVDQNGKDMKNLLEILRKRDVDEKDIRTTTFSVSPQYDYSAAGKAPRLVGYQVMNQVLVKIRKIGTIGGILDEVVAAGANQINGISFSVDEPTPLLDKARQRAIDDAHRKAKLYASAAGVKLGNVVAVKEEPSSDRSPPIAFAASAARASEIPMVPGEQEFQVRVIVSYGIEQP